MCIDRAIAHTSTSPHTAQEEKLNQTHNPGSDALTPPRYRRGRFVRTLRAAQHAPRALRMPVYGGRVGGRMGRQRLSCHYGHEAEERAHGAHSATSRWFARVSPSPPKLPRSYSPPCPSSSCSKCWRPSHFSRSLARRCLLSSSVWLSSLLSLSSRSGLPYHTGPAAIFALPRSPEALTLSPRRSGAPRASHRATLRPTRRVRQRVVLTTVRRSTALLRAGPHRPCLRCPCAHPGGVRRGRSDDDA